jgi:hypothetical protein
MWVILSYFERDPVQVYGVFASESEAREYAKSQGMAAQHSAAYDVVCVRDVNEE